MTDDKQKPPKCWRWVEVGEVLREGDYRRTKLAGQLRPIEEVYIRPLKSGDKPVTQNWLNKHKKISWNIGTGLVNVQFRRDAVELCIGLLSIPIENRRHLKQILKALRLPFEKVK